MSSKRMCILKSFYFRTAEVNIIFVGETESFQKWSNDNLEEEFRKSLSWSPMSIREGCVLESHPNFSCLLGLEFSLKERLPLPTDPPPPNYWPNSVIVKLPYICIALHNFSNHFYKHYLTLVGEDWGWGNAVLVMLQMGKLKLEWGQWFVQSRPKRGFGIVFMTIVPMKVHLVTFGASVQHSTVWSNES